METSDKNLEDGGNGKDYDQQESDHSDQENDQVKDNNDQAFDQAIESSQQTQASRKRNSMSDSGSGSDQESGNSDNEDQQVAKKPKLENDHSDQSQSPTQSPVSKATTFFKQYNSGIFFE